jgi:hypothetical protein
MRNAECGATSQRRPRPFECGARPPSLKLRRIENAECGAGRSTAEKHRQRRPQSPVPGPRSRLEAKACPATQMRSAERGMRKERQDQRRRRSAQPHRTCSEFRATPMRNAEFGVRKGKAGEASGKSRGAGVGALWLRNEGQKAILLSISRTLLRADSLEGEQSGR